MKWLYLMDVVVPVFRLALAHRCHHHRKHVEGAAFKSSKDIQYQCDCQTSSVKCNWCAIAEESFSSSFAVVPLQLVTHLSMKEFDNP